MREDAVGGQRSDVRSLRRVAMRFVVLSAMRSMTATTSAPRATMKAAVAGMGRTMLLLRAELAWRRLMHLVRLQEAAVLNS